MLGLTRYSTIEEAIEVLNGLTYEVEYSIGNGEGCYVAYCKEEPSIYYIADTADDAFYGCIEEARYLVMDYLKDG